MKRLLVPAALLVLMLLLAPEPSAADPLVLTGYASAYAPGVMEGVVALRYRENLWRNTPPRDPHDLDGYVASMDCSRVGQMATLYGPDGRAYSVLIADCAGPGDPGRFERMGVILELDGRLWATMTAAHGTPLEVGLR